MSTCDPYHFVNPLTPIRGIPYTPSSVQSAGWFNHPMYFADEESDGTRRVFCWSVSVCTEGAMITHYVWGVYQDPHFDLALVLCQQFRHRELTPFEFDNYIFTPLTSDKRAAWRVVKPLNILASPRVPVDFYPRPQPGWFGSNPAATLNLVAQLHALPPPYAIHQPVNYFAQDVPDLCTNLADMYFSEVSTPHAQHSNTSSEVSANAISPESSETDDPTRGSGHYFSVNESGVVTLIVPGHLRSPQAVKDFLAKALSSGELNKGIRKVKCSQCKNNKAKRTWDIKPSNLERHILAHLSIKCHPCSVCKTHFTTKDQQKKHIEKKHPEILMNAPGDENQKIMGVEHVARSLYAPPYSVTTSLPAQGIEPWANQVYQTLPPRDVVPLDHSCDFGY